MTFAFLHSLLILTKPCCAGHWRPVQEFGNGWRSHEQLEGTRGHIGTAAGGRSKQQAKGQQRGEASATATPPFLVSSFDWCEIAQVKRPSCL